METMIPEYPLFHYPFFCLCFFSSPLFPGIQAAAAMVSEFSWIWCICQTYWSINLSPTCNNSHMHPKSFKCQFCVSPSINLEEKKSLNRTTKLKKRCKREAKSKKQKGRFKWSRALLFKIRIALSSFSPTHNSWKQHLSWSPDEISLCKILARVA